MSLNADSFLSIPLTLSRPACSRAFPALLQLVAVCVADCTCSYNTKFTATFMEAYRHEGLRGMYRGLSSTAACLLALLLL